MSNLDQFDKAPGSKHVRFGKISSYLVKSELEKYVSGTATNQIDNIFGLKSEDYSDFFVIFMVGNSMLVIDKVNMRYAYMLNRSSQDFINAVNDLRPEP